jgi:hypothetical protein
MVVVWRHLYTSHNARAAVRGGAAILGRMAGAVKPGGHSGRKLIHLADSADQSVWWDGDERKESKPFKESAARPSHLLGGIDMRTAVLLLAAAATAMLAMPPAARAGHLFCHQCGCHQNCRKVCKLVCEKKKETTIEYSSECEEFCIPGPSHKCGVCYERDECGGHPHRKVIWQPTCAKVHTRKKLVKKEVTKEVPDYKWVVEEYCCICGVLVKMERGDGKQGKEADGGKSDKKDDGGGQSGSGDKSGGKQRTGQSPATAGPLALLPSIREYGMPSFERWRDTSRSYGEYDQGSAASAERMPDSAQSVMRSTGHERAAGQPAADASQARPTPPRRLFRTLFSR